MIDFYTAASSNGRRAAIMLEECGLPFTLHKVDLMGGEQRTVAFLSINPAGAIPVIVDHDGPGGASITLAQSGAIMLYLAEKTGRFLPKDPVLRAQAWQWLFQATTDVAATSMTMFLLSTFAPDKSEANDRFFEERVLRQLRAADQRLADRPYLAQELSVADFALYPVYAVRKAAVEAAGDLPHLVKWARSLAERPALARAMTLAG